MKNIKWNQISVFVSVTEELLFQLNILRSLNLSSQVQLNSYQVYLTREVHLFWIIIKVANLSFQIRST